MSGKQPVGGVTSMLGNNAHQPALRVRRRIARRLAGTVLAAAGLMVGLAAPTFAAPHRGVQLSPVSVLSTGCRGPNAEVVSAVGKPDYVYEAWIGCGGEGFARSTDGGLHFSRPITLPDSSQSDDPALAVAPDGTVYVSYLRYLNGYAYPVVATSFDHGATFPQVASLIPAVQGNWGDRDFIAAGPHGTVYVTWDYGPSIDDVSLVCSPVGSCAYSTVDATAVVQKSTDHGKTWGPITFMQPGFPAGGGYDGSVVVEPNGQVDALIWNHHLDPVTFAVGPGFEDFTSSSDGGRTWSPLVPVGGSAGAIALPTWWIDGNLGMDHAGNLYATWETQTASSGNGWISYSTDHGRTWSAPQQVLSGSADAAEDIEVVGTIPGVADVAWQDDTSPSGYATYLRQFSIKRGWLGPAIQVSTQFGDPRVWPGDTFGLSALPGGDGTYPATRVALSWGGGQTDSQIYERVVHVPPTPAG
jgi:BNR/Asp-box repeat